MMTILSRGQFIWLLFGCFCFIVNGDIPRIFCDFESGFCDFTQSIIDDFDWRRQSGSTPSSDTGPSVDHTFGSYSGYYIYIETTSGYSGYVARLVSPVLAPTPGDTYNCTVRFWYHMLGADIGTLNVYVTPPTYGTPKWTKSGNQLDSWYLGAFSFPLAYPDNLKVEFEGAHGGDYRGDIALDDLEINCELLYEGEPDETPPTITGCPTEIRVTTEVSQSETPVNWTEPSATDDFSITTIKSHRPLSLFPVGSTGVAYIFRDIFGNTAICSFEVIVETDDTIGPTIYGCPADIYAVTDITTNGTAVSWNEPNATDESGISQSQKSHEPAMEFPVGKTWVVYEYVDTFNNTANCTFLVSVYTVDIKPPVVKECPPSFDSVSGRHVTWTEPTASDTSGNVTVSRSHAPGEFLISSTQIVYTFTDSSNNTAYCNFTITMTHDTNPPLINGCPSAIYGHAELGESGTTVFWTSPSATDDFGRVLLLNSTHIPGAYFLVGTTPVVYKFVDDSYNLARCEFPVIVDYVDTTPPTIQSCPREIDEGIELGLLSTPVYWSTPSATDMSGNVVLVSQSHFAGDSFTKGRTNVNYTFADASGNERLCDFTVFVREVDTRAPTITDCPPDMMASKGSARFWKEPSATDLSGNVSLVVKTHSPGDFFPVGSTNVMYMFTDSSNNVAVCSFNIYVNSGNVSNFQVDITAPVLIYCPLDIHESAELGVSQVAISWLAPSAVDQYGSVTLISATHIPGDLFDVGSVTDVIYVFADDANNRATCSFSVRVTQVDTTPPSLDYCPDDITKTADIGVTAATVSWREPIASDLSGTVTLSSKSRLPTTFSPLRDTTVVYVFTDNSGNEAICQFVVSFQIVDTTPPSIINCPSAIYSSTEIGTGGTSVFWNNPSVMDLSGNVISNSSHIPGQFFSVGSTVVTYQYEDKFHNRAECHFTVHVTTVDTTPPEMIFCPDDVLETIEYGDISKKVSWSKPVASDVSGNVSLVSQSHFSGNDFTVGKTKVAYVFVDDAGNEAACNFYVLLNTVDTIAPTVNYCPDDITTSLTLGSFGSIVSWDEPKVEDITGEVILVVQTHVSGTFFAVGTTIVTYIFRDTSNNMERCAFSVTVAAAKTTTTIFNCPSNILASVRPGIEETSVTWIEPVAVNVAATTKMSSTHRPNDSFKLGSTPVEYTFEDDSGNREFCNFTVIVTKSGEQTGDASAVKSNGTPGKSTENGNGSISVSLASLVLSLLIIVLAIVILVIIYYRKKRNTGGIEMENLKLSKTASF